jgi:DNA primase
VIPQAFIQELLARVDIVDVVERYVPLKKAGANHVACCPFHSEKTPSFTVSQAKQFFHCFGCGAHGSAIGFVMQHAGLGFVEAVEDLAAQVGMQVPRQRGDQPAAAKSASLAEVVAAAARYYREQLKASPRAIEYLKRRGLTGEIAARFGIGYAPDGWQSLEKVFPDYRAPELLEAGLVVENETGRRYDRFRDRIMFPILDGRGNVIGFGGRVIGEGEPKYLNSPETPLFEKGRELYGLTQARQAIREQDQVIVVEGYMDVVALAQAGIANAVATLGTATTGTHAQKLLRLADRVVFCFDGDTAGRKAAWRALESSLEHLADDKSVGFLFLPPEDDPDSYVRSRGADSFRQLADRPVPLTECLLRELRAGLDLETAEGRSKLLHEAKPLLGRIAAPMLRTQLTRSLAQITRLTAAEVESLCGLKPAVRTPPPRRAPGQRTAPSLGRVLLKILVQKPGWAPGLDPALLPECAEAAALRALCDAADHGDLPGTGMGPVLEYFRGSDHEPLIARTLGELAGENFDEAAMEAVFNDAVEQLRRAGLSHEIAALNAKERSGGLSADERRQLAQLLSLKQRQAGAARGPELE